MVGFKRVSTDPYRVEPILIDLKEVMMNERKLPRDYLNEAGNGVAEEYLRWCRPLLGTPLPRLTSYNFV